MAAPDRPAPAAVARQRALPRGAVWADAFTRSELADQWDRYFELFNLAPVGYVLSDLRGQVREVNQAGAQLLGRSLRTLLGCPLVLCVAAPDRQIFLDLMRRVRADDGIIEADLTLERPGGTPLHVHLMTRRSPRFDQPPLCWTVIVDITAHQKLQEARELHARARDEAEQEQLVARTRSEAKDRFIAMLSHELRNPLAPALYAASQLSELANLPAPAVRLVEVIRRNVEFEARLIDELLDVTRIDKGKISLTLTAFDLHAVIAECVSAAQLPAQARQLTLRVNLGATRSVVRADQTRIRQVVWNLLSNAIKFTPTGGQIEVATLNDGHGGLRTAVTDTGIGIAPGDLGTLFAPFEQIGRPRHGGLGLGLSICRGIVDAHGGRIWVTSRGVNLGTTFEVELPTVEAQALTRPDDSRERLPTPATPSRRILVVEDHEDSAEMLRLALKMAGHLVETAASLSEALARLGESWDLVVSDLGLPDGSGLEVARQARTLAHPPGKLVALSGYGSDADRQASQRAGFDAHLIKPVLPNRILELLP